MFATLRNAWKIPDLRKKMLYTLIMIVVFRLGSFIPVPGIREGAFKELVGDGKNSLFNMLDMFSGGSFSQANIFAMSITPYINASIILQLLTVAVPALERLSKEGEEGRKKIAKWTRVLTVVLAIIQATGLFFGIQGITEGGKTITNYITIVATLTAGTAFLMWLGEQITQKGVGNGISILIFAGIVAGLPQLIRGTYYAIASGLEWWYAVILVAVLLAMIVFVIFVTDAERRVSVQYAKRMVGRKMYGGQSTHIPIKVAMAGVIPIIFAMSILSFPTTIMSFMGSTPTSGFWGFVYRIFQQTHPAYIVIYFLLIIFFTYFYTAIQFNPIEIANNMKKNGGFVPGIRPGKPTSDFISRILSRITLTGAFFLGIIAITPLVFAASVKGLSMMSIGGTSILIMVGVALETVKQIESQMMMRHYKGFLD